MAWIRPAASTWGSGSPIFQRDAFTLTEVAGNLVVALKASANASDVLTFAWDQSTYEDAWQHVAMSYDGSDVRLYIDGDEVASEAWTDPLVSDTGAIHVGCHESAQNFFEGFMTDACLFKTAQSASQIAAARSTRCVDSDGLVAYAPMDAETSDSDELFVVEVEMCAAGSVSDVSNAERSQLHAIMATRAGAAP